MKKQVKPASASTLNSSRPWWNQPVFGKGSLVEKWLGKIRKPAVPQGTVFLHNGQVMKAAVFAKTAKTIDSEKLGSPEFLFLVKLRYLMFLGLDEYQSLLQHTKFLEVAIAAKKSFIAVDQTELRYRSSKQQEVYNFVDQQLQETEIDTNDFRQNIEVKLSEIIPQIKTEEGKAALSSYGKNLNMIAEHSLGLKLLARFKSYQFNDYSVLQKIADINESLGKKDLLDFKYLTAVVMTNYDAFDALGLILELDQKYRNPETYAKMIQYVALNDKHKLSFGKFAELVSVIQRWYPCYQAILGIRQEYPPSDYRQPSEFEEPIPGEEIYSKYHKGLTDSKTGRSYIDFSKENPLINIDRDQFS